MSTTKVTDNLRDTTQVDAAKITTGTIPEARITSLDATKLTGTVDNARISLDANEIPNLDTAKVTSGTFADARISESSVTQHVTVTDTSSIENDIAVLALQNAVNSNITAHGLQNYWIEQFEDSNSITALTNCARNSEEFVSSIVVTTDYGVTSDTLLLIESDTTNNSQTFADSSTNNRTITVLNDTKHSTTQKKFGATSIYFDGTGDALELPDSDDWAFGGTGSHTIDAWIYPTNLSSQQAIWAGGPDGAWTNVIYQWYIDRSSDDLWWQASNNGGTGQSMQSSASTITANTWQHIAIVRNGLTDWDMYINGSSVATNSTNITIKNYAGSPRIGATPIDASYYIGYMDNFRITNSALWTSNFTPPTVTETINATGSFTSTTITPQDSASKSSLGLCLLYKNVSGTNTLNTDIVAKVSADNGSNYSTCVLASKGTFSTGINIAIAPAISVTAGTQLKYKIEFANQSSGSKEAQIHGVALSY